MKNEPIASFLRIATSTYSTVFKTLVDNVFRECCKNDAELNTALFGTVIGEKLRHMAASHIYDRELMEVKVFVAHSPKLKCVNAEQAARFLTLFNEMDFRRYLYRELELTIDAKRTTNFLELFFR